MDGSTGTATAGTNHPLTAISLTGGDDIIIRNFNLYGNFAFSGIMATVTACTRLSIEGGKRFYIWTENATDSAIDVLTSTGRIGQNITAILQDDAANITEAFRGASMYFISPLPVVNAAGRADQQQQQILLCLQTLRFCKHMGGAISLSPKFMNPLSGIGGINEYRYDGKTC